MIWVTKSKQVLWLYVNSSFVSFASDAPLHHRYGYVRNFGEDAPLVYWDPTDFKVSTIYRWFYNAKFSVYGPKQVLYDLLLGAY
jgi:hypothetical protein